MLSKFLFPCKSTQQTFRNPVSLMHSVNMAKANFGKICYLSELTPDLLKYEETIRTLNSLQSNLSTINDAKKSIQSGSDRINNVKNTAKYLQRVGVSIDYLNDRIIHISGTKGKGSTAMLTESLLRSVHYKTGLFTSPHLTCVRERIAIDGKPLSLTTFVDYFWQVYHSLSQQKDDEHDMPSYFKFLTVLALKVFTSENVDVAILEVGIGGELDCTNVFKNTPIVGITSIGLDHTNILGDTVEKIAWQKAGIMKPGCRAFTIPDHKKSVLEVLQARAAERKAHLEVVPQLTDYCLDFSCLNLPHKLNTSLALQLARAWEVWKNNKEHKDYDKLNITEREEKTIKGCQILGRCQIFHCFDSNVTYYLDGAHTIESLQVAKTWFEENSPKDNKRMLIFNVTGERPSAPLLKILADCNFSEVIFCSNNVSSKIEDLPQDFIKIKKLDTSKEMIRVQKNLDVWLSLNSQHQGQAVFTVAEALVLAQQSSSSTSVLVTGSLHLVGSVLRLLQNA